MDDTLNNQYIRLAADFENFRKRNEQEREALLKYGAESTLKKMLEVLDNFERGLKAIETVDDCEKVKECYNLAYKNFTDVLTKAGLETIKAEGEVFDPNFHEAVMQTPSSEVPEMLYFFTISFSCTAYNIVNFGIFDGPLNFFLEYE